MGVVKTITHNTFPKQTNQVGKMASLCFHYDTSPDKRVNALVARDDAEEPWITIFLTGSAKLILATECQYHLIDPE